MIGFYDYTVFLTYLSAISGTIGIMVSLSGQGHPYWGTFCLLLSGLCDAFDGKVARTKLDRTQTHKNYGIQIDSLADLIAFGVLPGAIGVTMYRQLSIGVEKIHQTYAVLLFSVVAIYVLAALIRLAFYNVTEEERQNKEDGVRKAYVGLPVTAASLIFPGVMLIQYLTVADITPVYLAVMLFTAIAFVSKIRVTKPGLRGILILVGIGALECAALILFEIFRP